MNRLKLLAAIALLGLPLAACEEATPPPPVGSIMGQVSIEGQGIDGVSVTLSNGAATSTAGGGTYRFDNVEGGTYTVNISGFPADASFDATSGTATIGASGETATVNFSGSYIRTASVMGTVTVENKGLGGVTVRLTGMADATTATDNSGQYAFTGLRAGTYSVEISGFDTDDVGFSNTAKSATVGVGESQVITFEGTYLRTAGIMGQVSVEGAGIEGVTVNLSGGEEDATTRTDASGQYAFAKLRAGDYSVGISGYDSEEYEFEVTSKSVSVALGETANVPFEGNLLRTAGISGRVAVEGTGIEGVTVTLSAADADDATTTTDASGQYAFAGLVAGDYTVAISGQDEVAYVFDKTTKDVTVPDDATKIVNFEGTHATTASISGMLFVDEAAKNDSYDEGEDGLPAAGVQLVLVGPGINDREPGATDEEGNFAFPNLRAGPYQLVVVITPEVEAALGDYAYGGPPTGYDFEVGVGAAMTQNIPFDITHQTVDFSVTLKSGEETGDALPGAAVSLYSDLKGETKVAGGMTGDDGMAAIRFARAATSGNTVYAAVSADDYDVADGMQPVMWDPKNKMSAVSNDADIVNLNVDVAFSGKTITTDYGGGTALDEWAVSVMAGEEAAEGAPEALDDDGMAAYKATVEAGSLPVTYTFAVADDQANAKDGGESYEGTELEYTHDGLSLAGTMDAGTLEVRFTTQTLRVYVHHERDQVQGYTGNILDGDSRQSGNIDVDVRYIDATGRSRSFATDVWKKTVTGSGANFSDLRGVVTFNRLPAGADIIVPADEAATSGNIRLLNPDELATYKNMEENGVTGGAFGAEGGYSHTVSLCPLLATDPTGQDHGECASFAYVSTHEVKGQVWKNEVAVDDAPGDGFKDVAVAKVAGITVDVNPVDGKNLGGVSDSYTTAAKDNKNTTLDERTSFNFGQKAAGHYTVSVPSGWRKTQGEQGSNTSLSREFNLDSSLGIDVTPATGVVYGRVSDRENFPVDGVTVNVNGESAVTDSNGRYIVDGFGPETRVISRVLHANKAFVETAHEGSKTTREIRDFAANTPDMWDIRLDGVGPTASISGKVTASGSDTPVAGVEIKVDGTAPENAATSGANKGMLVTGSDGTYVAIIGAKDAGLTADVTASKAGMTFVPGTVAAPAHAGAKVSGIDFTGFLNATVSGRVKGPDGKALMGVDITAKGLGTLGSVSATTGETGTFSLSLPFGGYTIEAVKTNYSFEYPNDDRTVSVAPGQIVNYGDIKATTFGARNVAAERSVDDKTGNYASDNLVKVTWTSGPAPAGYHSPVYSVEITDADGKWSDAKATVVDSAGTFTNAPDTEFMVRVLATAKSMTTGDVDSIMSAPVTVEAVDPSASGVKAERSDNDIVVTWKAVTNNNSAHRVVLEVDLGLQLGKQWMHPPTEVKASGGKVEIKAGSWNVAGTEQKLAVTVADLEKALRVRVDSKQGDAKWVVGTDIASVAAKPTG